MPNINASGQWFMTRRFLKIYQNFPYFATYGPQKGTAPLFKQSES